MHVHTRCSDGTSPPEEIPGMASQAGLDGVAITDHDAVDGIERAIEANGHNGLEIIPGVELSTTVGGTDIHILGYYIDWRDSTLLEWIALFREKRLERARKMVAKLWALGLDLRLDTVLEIADGAAIGRPHIADALVKEELIEFYGEAFSRFIGYDGPAYFPKHAISPAEAIRLIRQAGGIPVLAHPGSVHRDECIPAMVRDGLLGIEVFHPMHPPMVRRHYDALAIKHGILRTGGSDYHGEGRGRAQLGCENVPSWTAENLHTLKKQGIRNGAGTPAIPHP
ncbi:MAG: PHP domain-containing protein [Candidatus Latescibacterota bacterium]